RFHRRQLVLVAQQNQGGALGIEAFAVGNADVAQITVKQTQQFRSNQLALVDWDSIFFELEAFKRVRGFENLLIQREDLSKLFADGNGGWYTLYAPNSVMQPRTWAEVRQWQTIVSTLLKRLIEAFCNYHVDAFFERRLEYRELTADDENLPQPGEHWQVMVDSNEAALVADLKQLAADVEALALTIKKAGSAGALYEEPTTSGNPPRALLGGIHLFSPLLHMPDGTAATSRIKVMPVALKNSEFNFVKDLHKYLAASGDAHAGKEFFLLRNKARGGGIGFFEAGGFYPDFILWVLDGAKQYIVFIEPHGLIHEGPMSPKVQFFKTIKDIEQRLGDRTVKLYSFILSPTRMGDLQKWGISTLDDFRAINVMLKNDDTEYVRHMLEALK
ncbi:hypothetical protein, partial [Massilia sp. TSP1-1-2]|uniref:hypothetical protein n=1 Tax=Massilia sp. TSP1-1-2 TaxID=2804649 RepID=UPI003CEE19B7